ncbi:hypothetical protein ACFLZ2_02775 [Candidatus Margulisiibacteriota bacterium]
MHIGIDFDNTIVTYDNLFHKYALQLGLIGKEIDKNKQVIRDTIRKLPNGNDKWTELQGLVYGKYMDEAELMEGVADFLKACKKNDVKVSIVSHKTIFPAIGPKVNLQDAAKKWLKDKGFIKMFGMKGEDIVFEERLNGKLSQIKDRKCTHFIDDLPEVLLHPDFPEGIIKILYSKNKDCASGDVKCFDSWRSINKYLFK